MANAEGVRLSPDVTINAEGFASPDVTINAEGVRYFQPRVGAERSTFYSF